MFPNPKDMVSALQDRSQATTAPKANRSQATTQGVTKHEIKNDVVRTNGDKETGSLGGGFIWVRFGDNKLGILQD